MPASAGENKYQFFENCGSGVKNARKGLMGRLGEAPRGQQSATLTNPSATANQVSGTQLKPARSNTALDSW